MIYITDHEAYCVMLSEPQDRPDRPQNLFRLQQRSKLIEIVSYVWNVTFRDAPTLLVPRQNRTHGSYNNFLSNFQEKRSSDYQTHIIKKPLSGPPCCQEFNCLRVFYN